MTYPRQQAEAARSHNAFIGDRQTRGMWRPGRLAEALTFTTETRDRAIPATPRADNNAANPWPSPGFFADIPKTAASGHLRVYPCARCVMQ
jgi:hypothetical protein